MTDGSCISETIRQEKTNWETIQVVNRRVENILEGHAIHAILEAAGQKGGVYWRCILEMENPLWRPQMGKAERRSTR